MVLARVRPLFLIALTPALLSQHDPAAAPGDAGLKIQPRSDEGQKQVATYQLAPGLACDLVAAEPDVCNIVAFSIDGKGRLYACETFRIGEGVFDTRNYMQWKDRDLACLTVADREAKYREFIPNDLPKYDALPERVRMLVDTDRDGVFDRSTVFASDFHALADGIGSGVLRVGDDVFFTNIPKLWRLRDADDDGTAEERTALHDGFGVHTSLIGHDMHGLIVGPDRRLYFSIGDRGFDVRTGDTHVSHPHEGAVLRCELDGSGLEVVHRGLRNPQELAFDEWGDLFTGDNNSDGGDRARLVQIVPGADSGWRIGFQWLGDRGAWNREKMWHPRHPGQAAGILPPIQNFADGPSGLVYDVGIGLPDRFRGCFFLCDFRGGAAYSGIHAIRFVRAGAGYEVQSTEHIVWRALATDVEIGPDGALYFSDWVDGWSKTGKGRIYRVRTPEMANDMALRNTARLLATDMKTLPATQLRTLLGHADRRVRQEACFALVDLGQDDVLADVAKNGGDRRARVVALFGLGVLGRRAPSAVDAALPLLACGDADVRATAARVLGDARRADAADELVTALRDGNSRVRREAALALANLGSTARGKAEDGLFTLLRDNDDRDAVLRHAAAFALGTVAAGDTLRARMHDGSTAVRRGALLALARQLDPATAGFLADADAELRYEAARAIYEAPIDAAMPALAGLAGDDHADLEALDWRALNANRMLGDVEAGERLVHAATRTAHAPKTRVEAIEILAEWREPHGQDRVIGNWRPCRHPHGETVAAAFAAAVPGLLRDPAVAEAAAKAAGSLRLADTANALAELTADGGAPTAARVAALNALSTLASPHLEAAVDRIDATAPVPLRKRAVELMAKSSPQKAVPVLATLVENASLAEQQAAFTALGDMDHPAATAVLRGWLERLARDDVAAAVRFDLVEAAAKHAALAELVAGNATRSQAEGELGLWLDCRDGGDPRAGRKVFFDNEATRCTRCHTFDGQGGNAGPVLDSIGKTRDRDYLLAALITPSAQIAEGFGTTTVELHDGNLLSGVVTRDQDGGLVLVDSQGESHDVAWTRIKGRKANSASAMPPMGGQLNRRQIRDLIAFLAEQRK